MGCRQRVWRGARGMRRRRPRALSRRREAGTRAAGAVPAWLLPTCTAQSRDPPSNQHTSYHSLLTNCNLLQAGSEKGTYVGTNLNIVFHVYHTFSGTVGWEWNLYLASSLDRYILN